MSLSVVKSLKKQIISFNKQLGFMLTNINYCIENTINKD